MADKLLMINPRKEAISQNMHSRHHRTIGIHLQNQLKESLKCLLVLNLCFNNKLIRHKLPSLQEPQEVMSQLVDLILKIRAEELIFNKISICLESEQLQDRSGSMVKKKLLGGLLIVSKQVEEQCHNINIKEELIP